MNNQSITNIETKSLNTENPQALNKETSVINNNSKETISKTKPKKTNLKKTPSRLKKTSNKDLDNNISAYDKLSYRHKLFVDNYIKCFFNATKAYLQTYPNATYDSARVMSSNFLTNINILNAIDERVQVLNWWDNFNDKAWAEMGFEMFKKCRNEGVKARIWEILAKAKNIFQENNAQVAIFQQFNDIEDKILKKRVLKTDENEKSDHNI